MPGRRSLIGSTIGDRYLIRAVLGEGGMGTVFEAVHFGSGRVVAIKVLNAAHAQRGVSVKRFDLEARAAAAIGHGNICQVYDTGSLDDGSPYMVMECLTGETLAARIAREGGLPIREVVDLLLQVLSGLDAAHRKGVLHRDIKPENIFLTSVRHGAGYSIAKILDFGVSKMLPLSGKSSDELDLTRTGMVMGTPYYMAPEQARGQRDLDARVDIYASGVVLYEALAGQRPFVASNYNALLMQILTATPPPLRDLRPNLPPDLEHVVERGMARARHERFSSAAEFHGDLLTLMRDLNPEGVSQETPAVRSGDMRSWKSRLASPRGTPSSVEIPVEFSERMDEGTSSPVSSEDDFDDLPTEIARSPLDHLPFDDPDDPDDAAATEVRADARDLRTSSQQRPLNTAPRGASRDKFDEATRLDRPPPKIRR